MKGGCVPLYRQRNKRSSRFQQHPRNLYQQAIPQWENGAFTARPQAYANHFEQSQNPQIFGGMNHYVAQQYGYNMYSPQSFPDHGYPAPYGGVFYGQGFEYPQSSFQPNYQGKKQKLSETVLQNPLQQPDYSYIDQFAYAQNNQPFLHPYPKQSAIPRPPSGMKSIMNSFKTQDGSFDVNKMVDTAGQMMNAVTQVSSMVKGLGGIFKV